jgi:hypothetical protein
MSHDRRARDRGQVAIEYLGFIPILILVTLAAVQLGLIAYTAGGDGSQGGRAQRLAPPGRPARVQ